MSGLCSLRRTADWELLGSPPLLVDSWGIKNYACMLCGPRDGAGDRSSPRMEFCPKVNDTGQRGQVIRLGIATAPA